MILFRSLRTGPPTWGVQCDFRCYWRVLWLLRDWQDTVSLSLDVIFLEIPDWRDDYDTIKIIDRGPPATLTPFYEGIKTPPPCITYHRHDPVMLAVKCKPRATGTLRTEYPQYVSVVLLVECIAHVSEYKPQILLMCVIFQNPHGVYVAFNKNIHSPEQLFCYIWSIFFCPLHHQDELHHHMFPCLPNYNCSKSWVIIKINKTPCHYGMIHRTVFLVVHHTLRKWCNNKQ